MNFKEILIEVQNTRKSIKTFPYIATAFLGVTRRGLRVNDTINRMLDEHDVICEPEFGSAWFYGQIEIKPKPKVVSGKNEFQYEDFDPTPRLSLLKAANLNKVKEVGESIGLITVSKNTDLQFATSLMLLHDFSQIPILSSMRDVEGIVSWKSIGRATSLGKSCKTVNDCKDDVMVLNYNEPLFNAVKYVLEKEFVLVRQKDKTISGIVTVTDIGEQFISMAEPFLIIEQIENHVRRLLENKFEINEITFPIVNDVKPKLINNLSDLTFGQYVKIFEDPKKYEKLHINFDRTLLVKQLEEVRKIRNDVMHFDPDGITNPNLDLLRQTASLLHTFTNTLNKKSIN